MFMKMIRPRTNLFISWIPLGLRQLKVQFVLSRINTKVLFSKILMLSDIVEGKNELVKNSKNCLSQIEE